MDAAILDFFIGFSKAADSCASAYSSPLGKRIRMKVSSLSDEKPLCACVRQTRLVVSFTAKDDLGDRNSFHRASRPSTDQDADRLVGDCGPRRAGLGDIRTARTRRDFRWAPTLDPVSDRLRSQRASAAPRRSACSLFAPVAQAVSELKTGRSSTNTSHSCNPPSIDAQIQEAIDFEAGSVILSRYLLPAAPLVGGLCILQWSLVLPGIALEAAEASAKQLATAALFGLVGSYSYILLTLGQRYFRRDITSGIKSSGVRRPPPRDRCSPLPSVGYGTTRTPNRTSTATPFISSRA